MTDVKVSKDHLDWLNRFAKENPMPSPEQWEWLVKAESVLQVEGTIHPLGQKDILSELRTAWQRQEELEKAVQLGVGTLRSLRDPKEQYEGQVESVASRMEQALRGRRNHEGNP